MENSKQIILPVVLKGDNYLLWSRITRTVLCSRGLWDHITGTQIMSNINEEKGKTVEGQGDISNLESSKTVEGEGESSILNNNKWFQQDQLVLSTLQSSFEQSILVAYAYCDTAKELWDTLSGIDGNISNLIRIFEVKKALNDLQQEGKSFTQHFGDFRSLWAELDLLRPATSDPLLINERREQDQVFGLLLTLDKSYNSLIRHILRSDKLLSLNEVCMQIQKEEGSIGLFGQKVDLVVVSNIDFKKNDRKKVFVSIAKGRVIQKTGDRFSIHI